MRRWSLTGPIAGFSLESVLDLMWFKESVEICVV